MQPLTVVSNRLPVALSRDQTGAWRVKPGPGGLVQAMGPILRRSGGLWIGWPGIPEEDLDGGALPADMDGYRIAPVMLSRAELEGYYAGMANAALWPLLHGFADRCDFNPDFWTRYQLVNDKFAASVDRLLSGDGGLIWVHDYHLIPLARALRSRRPHARIGFFLHTPFPALQTFVTLPWRAELLRALFEYDLVGFQTDRDRENFLDCVERLVPAAGVAAERPLARVSAHGRQLWVGTFPIGIDSAALSALARSPAVEDEMRALSRAIGRYPILLGVDRLDYTKGLVERLRAFETALRHYPELRERVVLFQIVVPSRETVPEYRALKRELDRMVGEIDGRFATPGWEPIRYLYDSVDRSELVALYRLASAALVTPLCDGMNLVAKEFCAAQVDARGSLILGEMTGAAAQLSRGALLVNPYDVEGTAAAIRDALAMNPAERRRRMTILREVVRNTDVYWWAQSFIDALTEPTSVPSAERVEYLPTIDDIGDGPSESARRSDGRARPPS